MSIKKQLMTSVPIPTDDVLV